MKLLGHRAHHYAGEHSPPQNAGASLKLSLAGTISASTTYSPPQNAGASLKHLADLLARLGEAIPPRRTRGPH